jgi:hypothetical protein
MKALTRVFMGLTVIGCAVVTLFAAASYPSSVKSFSTKTAGQTIGSAHINDLQDEVVAIENGLLNGLAHDLKFTDATYDIGKSGATRPRDLFLSRNLTVGGGQIAFPSTQVPSTDVNTLDDYEEGSWTPVIGGSGGTSGQTYSQQIGSYVKVGKLVTAWFNVTLSAKGTITTDVQIQGLPFTIENTSAGYPLTIGLWTNMTSSVVWIGGFGVANTTTATVYRMTAAGVSSIVAATADISNSTQLVGSITYRASS